MKRKTKILISALSVMLVAAIGVAIASFSLAGKDEPLAESTQLVANANENMDTKTIIDYIIENSNSEDDDVDKVYHIAEVSSSGTASNLEAFAAGGFKDYVIDGHRTIADLMAEGCIDYRCMKGNTTDSEDIEFLNKADLIYVSNDASSKFVTGNDLSEDVYDLIHTYALGKYQPLIIDRPDAKKIDNPADVKTTNTLASKVFLPNEKVYYTYKWTDGLSAADYLGHKSGSLYLGINGTAQKKSGVWSSVYEVNPTTDTSAEAFSVARILTISASGTSTAKTDAILTGCTPKTELYNEAGENIAAAGKYYSLDATSALSISGYNGRYARPSYIKSESVKLEDVAGEAVVLTDYDMVILEDDCINQTIAGDVYTKLAKAMYAKVHIVYSAAMGTVDATTPDVPSDLNQNNYSKLYYLVASTDNVAKTENVMVTTREEFGVITSATDAASAKVIADLINNSAWRGIGGPGSSNKFTVLEIQPCYPVDRDLADAIEATKPRKQMYAQHFGKGNYYTVPAQVMNGFAKEQLEEGTEYYAWELSKAKIADALNLSANQINLVQMSSEELSANKTEIVGNYDMVYIGGNTSALKDIMEYNSLPGLTSTDNWLIHGADVSKLTTLPIYTMYAHGGDMVQVSLGHMGESGGPVRGGTPMAKVVVGGSRQDSFALLNGNDITYDNYKDLEKYIKLGMPIVLSSQITNAYNAVIDFGYKQNSIDPDSNMFKVLQACAASTKGNVLTDFDAMATVSRDNDSGRLGSTVTGYVSVFATSDTENPDVDAETGEPKNGRKEDFANLYLGSTKRPKLSLTSMPRTYSRFDDATKLTDHKLKFKYNVSGSTKYSVKLYIDDDGNSKFDRTAEFMANGNATELTYTCANDFFGPLYWMIEVTDTNTKMTASTTGICYIQSSSPEKQRVSVLQIMPGAEVVDTKWDGTKQLKASVGEGAQGYNSLYFCTVCQQAYERLEYNPVSNAGGRTHINTIYGGNYLDSNGGKTPTGVYLGKHEHTFGIVQYDSNLSISDNGKTITGIDNWDYNLADEIADRYDFDIEIMIREEFEKTASKVREAYVKDPKTGEAYTAQYKQDLIDSFVIDESDEDYEAYEALTTDDDRFEFIKKREFSQEASKYWQLYQYMSTQSATAAGATIVQDDEGADITMTTVDAEKLLVKAIDSMLANNMGSYTSVGNDDMRTELERIKKLRRYSDYYSIGSLYYYDPTTVYSDAYKVYVEAKDKELQYKELFMEYSRYAGGDDWLLDCYSTVILGPAEDFAGDDIKDATALADLASYIENDGQVILFHDTLTKFADAGSSTLTATLRSYFGMDRYHMDTSVASGSYYPNYTSSVDDDEYFFSNLSSKDKTDATRFSGWVNEMKTVYPGFSPRYLTSTAYTDGVYCSGTAGINACCIPYRYAEAEWSIQSFWYNGAKFNAKDNDKYGTTKASQNNKGIVTLYPFTLASELNVGGTHQQAYALDLEDENMTVWYSLAGDNNTKAGSSLFAGSPRDGRDNYFIYTYGNVNYCGAGHSNVTGIGKDNNDERYLYLNIICNSVRKSVKQPSIFVYDYDAKGGTINKKIKQDINDEYSTKVEDMESYPEFNFKVTVDPEAKLSKVKIYYDLDYSETNRDSSYVAGPDHVLIADWTRTNVEEGAVKPVFRYDSTLEVLYNSAGNEIREPDYTYIDAEGNEVTVSPRATKLKLQPEYFAPYNNEYTYVVIEAIDTKGNKVYQRIKIMIKDYLFNLT